MRSALISTFLSTILTLPSFVTAVTLSCDHVRAGGADFDLRALEGFHSIDQIQPLANGNTKNITFLINLCKAFGPSKDKDRNSTQECPNGTRGIAKLMNTILPLRSLLVAVLFQFPY